MDAFLNFFISNLAIIIQWLIAIILLLIGSWFVLLILSRKESPSEGVFLKGADLSSLEPALREIAQKGTAASGVVSSAPVVGEETGEATAPLDGPGSVSVEQLMQELAQKEAEIQVLKETAPAKGASEEEVSSYLEKIKELEGKLAEYGIIEDDIADLSMYKEENARLKRRLEGMGQTMMSGEVAPVQAPAGEVTPAASQPSGSAVEKEEDLVAELATTVEATEAAPKTEELSSEEPEPASDALDKISEPTEALDKISESTEAPLESPSLGEEADDILAEFTNTLTAPPFELNTQDSEAASGGGESALEDEVDTDKVVVKVDKLISGE